MTVSAAPREKVYLPEFDGYVWVKAVERADCLALWPAGVPGALKVPPNVTAKLVARVVVDADGNRIFNDADAPMLSRKFAPALRKCWNKAWELRELHEQIGADER